MARKAQAGAVPAPAAPLANAAELPEGSGRFPVLSPLRFDGRLYRPDDPEANEVVMPRDQAQALRVIDVLGDELPA
ncbi:hypothetical protein ABE438_14665 [Bosea sp. TWI1241]|uniref:hypothetical protein n=1 Tax=Bosea sp. TWI1241 TaxID=3148904 RepID=UPI0032092AFF